MNEADVTHLHRYGQLHIHLLIARAAPVARAAAVSHAAPFACRNINPLQLQQHEEEQQ